MLVVADQAPVRYQDPVADTACVHSPSHITRSPTADRRALSPLFWTHVDPYGRFELDMNRRLDLDLTARDALPRPRAPEGRPAWHRRRGMRPPWRTLRRYRSAS